MEYQISGSLDSAGGYTLQFGTFIRQLSDWFKIKGNDAQAKEAQGGRYSAGGTIDFFQKGMAGPYIKLIYPSVFKNSGSNTTSFPGEHCMLLSCGSLAMMKASLEILNKPSVVLDKVPGAILFFRGRSILTVKLPIWWRGERRLVDIGTTLGLLMEQEGIPAAMLGKLRWKRSLLDAPVQQSKDGYLLLQADTEPEQLMEMPVLQGDELTFD